MTYMAAPVPVQLRKSRLGLPRRKKATLVALLVDRSRLGQIHLALHVDRKRTGLLVRSTLACMGISPKGRNWAECIVG